MLSLKNSLVVLKKTDALLEGHFVLSSGLHSPQYVQCAKLLSKPNQAKKFKLRRGFNIKKKAKILIVEEVITTGKSSLECVRLIKRVGGKFVGIACLIDRSKKLKMSKKIISQVKLDIPVYKRNRLPTNLKNIQITKPGSRYLR